MNIENDELISEVNRRHGISLTKDDPVLILQTMNSQMIDRLENRQRVMFEEMNQSLQEIAHNWDKTSREITTKAINVTINASRNEALTLIERASDSISTKMRYEGEIMIENIKSMVSYANRLAIINVMSGVVNLMAIIILVYLFAPKLL